MKTIASLAAICFLITGTLSAQRKNSIIVLSKPQPDGVWLRWAPVNVAVWQTGNLSGYTIERFTMRADGEMESNSKVVLTPLPLKPLPQDVMEKRAETVEEVGVLSELIYGSEFNTAATPGNRSAILSKNRELENRFGLSLLMCDLSTEVAEAAGLFWKDKTAQQGKRYIYRVKQAGQQANFPVEPAVTVVSVAEPKPLPPIKDLKAQFNDRKVTLRWATLLHRGVYSAYYVERSSDGKNFTKLSDIPYVSMSEKQNVHEAYYVDSLAVNGVPVHYRIKGVSPFAKTGPYSNVVSGTGREDLTGLLIIREGKVIGGNSVRIAWEFPPAFEKQIEGFLISSAGRPEGPFVEQAKKPFARNVRGAVETTPHYNTYYILRAVDSKGAEVARSFPYLVQIADDTPPLVPATPTGTMDNNGVVRLSWAANKDKDLLGYRVFRRNAAHEEWVEVTQQILGRSAFIDTVNIHVLNKKIYYSIIAVDKNYNTSNYSNPVLLYRPDDIAPTAPVFLKTDVFKDSIVLAWQNSASEDVAYHELSRVEKDERLERVIQTWKPPVSIEKFKDESLEQGKTYAYRLTVYDSAGNKNGTLSKEIFFESGIRRAVSVKAEPDKEKKSIALLWKNQEPAIKCVVYRKINDDPLKLYTVIEGNIEVYTDKNLKINNSYVYRIQLIMPSGVRSELSQEVVVRF
ncbi:fibronectin type III domain-containing protein [Chryseolinea soli]|uniref:Fibronectin type-III domain-containing protein n=1 Tax=Chryseolinea soli TaxID=2321403 RepID=A0A385SFK3_9BACT|nr:fibronectin type III domain-containing protein [Chryseolinea soli]AYB29166.1 hypothetical protein D4L85_00565 [Chryseolinea soli]